jgi:hypothetical protein
MAAGRGKWLPGFGAGVIFRRSRQQSFFGLSRVRAQTMREPREGP